jgi:hypothetical protein
MAALKSHGHEGRLPRTDTGGLDAFDDDVSDAYFRGLEGNVLVGW